MAITNNLSDNATLKNKLAEAIEMMDDCAGSHKAKAESFDDFSTGKADDELGDISSNNAREFGAAAVSLRKLQEAVGTGYWRNEQHRRDVISEVLAIPHEIGINMVCDFPERFKTELGAELNQTASLRKGGG